MKKKSNKYSIYKTEFFNELNIDLIENDQNEIKSYTEEMFYSLEDKLNYTDDDEKLINEFWENYKQFSESFVNSYYFDNPIKSNISTKYLLNQFKKSKNK